jgi:predicted acetyltransferase
MNLYSNTIINCGGIGEVCVDLLHKKEHVAKDLMIFAHNHFYERDFCLLCLYPFAPDFYAKMGYGLGNKMNQYSFEPKALKQSKRERISYLTLADRESVSKCFNSYATSTHGMILRTANNDFFKHMLGGMQVIGYWKNGKLLGYLAFRTKQVEGGSWLQHNIHIIEFIYSNPEVFQSLLSFLAIQQDQVHRIIYNTHDHHFQHFLKEPRSRGNENIFHSFQESNIQEVGIMYRLINTSKFFSLLSAHNFGGQNLKLKINVVDTFLSENNGTVMIEFQKGIPLMISDGDEHDVEISINNKYLSSLIMGVVSFKKLYEYGLVEVSDKEYIDSLNILFMTDEPPTTFEPF